MTLQNIIPANPFSGLIAFVHHLSDRAADRRKQNAVYTRTLNELSALSNRELADIGLHRCEISRIAAEAAKMN